MKALATLILLLVCCAPTSAAPPDTTQLPKELWEKKVEIELAALRFEAETMAKSLRGSRDKLLLLAQQVERSDRAAGKPLREALAA